MKICDNCGHEDNYIAIDNTCPECEVGTLQEDFIGGE